MSLLSAKINEPIIINRVQIMDKHIKHHLANIGINEGCQVKILKKSKSGLILEVQGSRLALSNDIAIDLIL